MKRRICVVLIIAMVISLIGIGPFKTSTYADDETKQYGNLFYIVSDGEVTITGCEEKCAEEILVPDAIDGLKVTKIGDIFMAMPMEMVKWIQLI